MHYEIQLLLKRTTDVNFEKIEPVKCFNFPRTNHVETVEYCKLFIIDTICLCFVHKVSFGQYFIIIPFLNRFRKYLFSCQFSIIILIPSQSTHNTKWNTPYRAFYQIINVFRSFHTQQNAASLQKFVIL